MVSLQVPFALMVILDDTHVLAHKCGDRDPVKTLVSYVGASRCRDFVSSFQLLLPTLVAFPQLT